MLAEPKTMKPVPLYTVLAQAPFIGILVLSFTGPAVAFTSYIALFAVVVLAVRLVEIRGRARVRRLNLDNAQRAIVGEYFIALRWPVLGMFLSRAIQTLRGISFFVALPLLVYWAYQSKSGAWWYVAVLLVALVYTGSMTIRTAPGRHLPRAVNQGVEKYILHFAVLQAFEAELGPGWLKQFV